MIRTLDRYLLRSFLVNYLLATSVMISLYVVLDLFVNIDEFTETGEEVGQIAFNIADYYLYNVPLYFAQIAGVITLFAACGVLARLQRQNEITAVLASGTSLYRLVAPIVLGSLGLNLLLIIDREVILPSVAPKLARQRDDVQGNRTDYSLWLVSDGESRLISAQRFWPKQGIIGYLSVMELSTDPATVGRIADVITADRAKWNLARRGWDLEGRALRISEATDGSEQTIKRESISFYPCRLSPEELLFRKMAQWVQFLSYRQLKDLADRDPSTAGAIADVIHGRFTAPISNMILLLLGMSFFMTRLPGSVLTQGAKSLGVSSICFLLTYAGQQAVGTAGLDSSITAWLPLFVFGPVAVLLLDNVKT